MLTKFVFPHLGSRPIGEIAAPDVLRLLRRIEARGKHETAHRTRQRCSQIFRFAVASGRARGDVTVDLRGALAAVKTESLAAIVEPARIGELLRAIDGYQGHLAVTAALKLAPRTCSCGPVSCGRRNGLRSTFRTPSGAFPRSE